MLVLTMYAKQERRDSAVVDLREFGLGVAKVTLLETRGPKARIGFDFDEKVPVHRKTVFDGIERNKANPKGEEAA